MKRFSMPADFKPGTLEGYARLHEEYEDCRVIDTYGNVTVDNRLGSGRSIDRLPRVTLPELAEYIRCSREKGIDFCYTINASSMQNRELTREGASDIKEWLGRLRDAGVQCLIVAMPSLIELIRSMDFDFKIKSSVIAQITSVNKAMAFKKMGVDRITIDECANRDFETLRRIRESFGEEAEIIVNSVCHQDCHYRMFHYNQIASDSIAVAGETSCTYYPTRCAMRIYEDPANYFKATWIRPEDLHYYREIGISYFKLQGRQAVAAGDPVRAAECYFKEAFEGDLKDLLYLFAPPSAVRLSVDNRSLDGFLKPFFEQPGFCDRDCTRCDYCGAYARKILGDDETRD
ncbi:MAG: U32 family peptidase, partial [Lentisphaerae bacterium]|nr:U32 family peptidase [Lentisphaerota bacterium]